MDPITILAAVGTTLKIVKEVCEGLKWMQRVYENVTHGDKILQSIALECNIYGESIKTIGQWLKQNQNAAGMKRQLRTTHNAITLVQVSMANLLLDLKKVRESSEKMNVKDKIISKDKLNVKMFQAFIVNAAKQQWFQETMRIHLAELRAHASTLHLTLGVIELTQQTPEQKEKAPERVEDKAEQMKDKTNEVEDNTDKTKDETEEVQDATGILEEKTRRLEKRLLLRHIITKALEIKRAEIGELASRDKPESLTADPAPACSPGSIQGPYQKLSFYDVVQLARQQASVEKARRSSVNLIDFSDTPQPISNQALASTGWSNLDLLESCNPTNLQEIDPSLLAQDDTGALEPNQDFGLSSNHPAGLELNAAQDQNTPTVQNLNNILDSSSPMALQAIDPSLIPQDDHGASKLSEAMEISSIQSASPEVDTTMSPKPSGLNPFKSVDLHVSQDDSLQKEEATVLLASTLTSNRPEIPVPKPGTGMASEETDNKATPSTFELVGPKHPHTGELDNRESNEPSASLVSLDQPGFSTHQLSAAPTGQENIFNETSTDISTPSTPAASIFSYFSSQSSATHASLSRITEEDLENRHSSSQASLKRPSIMPISSAPLVTRKALGSERPSITTSPVQGNDAGLYRSSSTCSAPTKHEDLELPSELHRTKSDDGVAVPLSPSPLLSNIDEPDEQGFPWIILAARDGNEELIQKLLNSDADIKVSHATTRRHALSEASKQGHLKCVNLLIEQGCPLEDTDAEGYTALHHACQEGHLAVVKSLVTNNAVIDAPGPQGQTALHLAMQVPQQNIVMFLTEYKACVNARDFTFRTPLHIGASQGNISMCNWLLDAGAQLDSREAQSKTSLQIACEAGHYELVEILLNRSDLNPTNMTFLDAFFAAVECGHVRIAECFFARGFKLQELKNESYKPATLAAKSGSLAMVELMIKENCDINAEDEYHRWNALHFASYYGHYQVIERLIASGASTEATTSKKETPLLFAVKGGHFAVVDRLLRGNKGGDIVSAEDEQAQQPVHHAVRAGSVEIFNLLMSNGAKINVQNSFGWLPIHIAVAYGHATLVERLLEQGANVDERLGSAAVKKSDTHKMVEEGYWAEARWPYPGSCPLHLACEYGHYDIARCLIGKGAKKEATCSEGWQPLHHAAFAGSSALVEMLLGTGVYPHATTNEGKTAQELQFCTSGAPISENEKEHVRTLLREAVDKVRKQKHKSFKMALKRGGSTVDEKNNLIRAATFSMHNSSRPHAHRTMSTPQTSNPPLTHSPSVSSPLRPPNPHHPHTSPSPLTHSHSVSSRHSVSSSHSISSSHRPSTPHLPVSQAEPQSPTPPVVPSSNLPDTNITEPEVMTANSVTDQTPSSSSTNPSIPIPTPNTETSVSVQSRSKMKRMATFGKVKPGLDIEKMGLGSVAKHTMAIGKQTLDIGKQTIEIGKHGIEMGKQGIEMGKQGIEMGKQGIEMGKQGIELGKQGIELGKHGLEMGKQGLAMVQDLGMGKQSVDMGKLGYKKAKILATKGKKASGKMVSGRRTRKSKITDANNEMGVTLNEDVNMDINHAVDNKLDSVFNNRNDRNDDDDDDFSDGEILDDAISVFSLDEFADLGSADF